MSEIERSIAELEQAVRAAGFAIPAAPLDAQALQALRELVHPLRLPAELEIVWQRFAGGPRWLLARLDMFGPALCVEMNKSARALGYPPHLLMVGGEGYGQVYLELHDEHGTGGGTVWYGDAELDWVGPVAPSLAALLDVTAEAWRRGIFSPDDSPAGVAYDGTDAWAVLADQRLSPRFTVPWYPPEGWADRWSAFRELDLADSLPRAGTVAIAEVVASGPSIASARIEGRVALMSGQPESWVLTVRDPSGELEVYVPHAADPFHLVSVVWWLQLDIVREPPPEDIRSALSAITWVAEAVRHATPRM